MAVPNVKALIFDTFGTVVDWRSSVIAELEALAQSKDFDVDAAAFVDAWRAGYKPAMSQVSRGARPWTDNDVLHRERLDELLDEFAFTGLSEQEVDHLNRAWHRVLPWPDSVAGLQRLKSKFILAPFSNGSFACLVSMARHGGLPWDCILSSDVFRAYKPDPATYLGAIKLLGLAPREIMLVAAHNYDHRNAAYFGMRTAFVVRPTEYGPEQKSDLDAEGPWDFSVDSLTALADALDA